MISGIYKIINLISGKYYVGSSKNIIGNPKSRWDTHKRLLNANKHFNQHLQLAWNKYKNKNFSIVICEEYVGNTSGLLNLEQKYLDIALAEKTKCYNMMFVAGRGPGLRIGTKLTKEHRKNLSLSHIGQKSWNKGLTKETNMSLMKTSMTKTGKSNFKCAKIYKFISPNKSIIEVVNLKKFCNENNLNYSTMNCLYYGKRRYKSHKGYTQYV